VVNSSGVVEGLDLEWLALIMEAKDVGISKEAVRNFLNQRENEGEGLIGNR
jgi:DNA-binding transcriptional MerR regulator